MDYKVLYRKYRPSNFNEIVGQEHIKSILVNSIKNNKIAHAYIFTGPRGTGKTSTAKIFAKTLNCLNNENGISCGECNNCINFNTTPDIIEMDAASNNSVEDIRNIVENVMIAPTTSKYKIYIIDEVHMLSTSAWNAFLKTLEEPPQNVIFILATTDIQKVPITVLSRCQRFDFSRIDKKLIFDNLSRICDIENIKYEEEALNEIAYISDGCMRDALSILDQLSKVSNIVSIDVLKQNYGTVSNADIDYIYNSIIHNDIDELVDSLRKIKESGVAIKIFIDKILENFIDKAINIKKKNISGNAFNQLKKIIEKLNNLLVSLNDNTNGYLLLELELISFINDEDNKLSNREIDKIISREIMSIDTKIDVNTLLDKDKNQQIYNICDEFINVRINNSFVGASKENKAEFLTIWDTFKNNVKKDNIKEYLPLIKSCIPQVVSNNNVLFISNNESIKVVSNSKLYDIETSINSINKTNYKMIFISKNDWDKYMKDYDKSKVYEYIDDKEFYIEGKNSIKLAEDIFGNEKINLE